MSDDRPARGPVTIPDALFEATDEETLRAKREAEFVATLEAKVRAGEMTIRDADKAMLDYLAEADFSFFSDATQAQIRDYADMLLDASPELVESRARVAEAYNARTGDEEEPA